MFSLYETSNGPYAHTLRGKLPENWEPLQVHLAEVETLAALFAGAFKAEAWGAVLGRCHDLGKGSREFQDYLRASSEAEAADAGERDGRAGSVDHKTFGARYVAAAVPGIVGQMLAYCITGHHGGLPDALSDDDARQRSTLRYRLHTGYAERHALPDVPPPYPPIGGLGVPGDTPSLDDQAFTLAFFTRMLFSCLVDADRTCTEAFCDPVQSAERQVQRPSMAELQQRLASHVEGLAHSGAASPVNRVRQSVLAECRAAAALPPGFFSLQVPTGGGKTLSSLMFALDHAVQYADKGLRRIVVAIPFTSIIEQTAGVYREALGPLAETAVLEHHTNVEPERQARANRLATENWDAPLIVTTNVQLLESLYSARTTPCRKLHRLAGSIIVLDEAQTLPVELLHPTLRALRELVERYGCTVVLCTATQPALEQREDFPLGLPQGKVRPIIAEPETLFAALRRVEVRYEGKLGDAALLQRLATAPKMLAIVNTRTHAAKLFNELREICEAGTCFHLSTLMCGAHRKQVLQTVRDQVKDGGAACRVVSTQLIEAGVDLDFPVVYRAEAGFDSLAQAAGRCNREGALPGLGTVHVFEAEKLPPPGFLRDTAQVARELLPRFRSDLLSSAAIQAYFRHYYWKSADVLDEKRVLEMFSLDRDGTVFQFEQAADAYRLIEETQVPVLVPYSEMEQYDEKAKKYIDDLQSGFVEFIPQRKLQPYLVTIPERIAQQMERHGAMLKHASGVWLLLRKDLYDKDQGLKLGDPALDERAWGV